MNTTRFAIIKKQITLLYLKKHQYNIHLSILILPFRHVAYKIAAFRRVHSTIHSLISVAQYFLDIFYDMYMLGLTATAILLGAFCQHAKKLSTYLLRLVIIVIMTIPIHHTWIQAIDLKMGLTELK